MFTRSGVYEPRRPEYGASKTKGDCGVASWGEPRVREHSGDGRQRCLGCGVQIESTFAAGIVPRCARCLEEDRPVDPVLRWIWSGSPRR
jgi:hypothetical protein